MERQLKIGMMLYCALGEQKSVFTEEKYKALAERFVQSGATVETILYNDARDYSIYAELKNFDAVLVWVNPIEQGRDRTMLDALLLDLQDAGVLVSSVPETIMKIGTKKVLFDTRNLEFGSNVEIYSTFDDFKGRFLESLRDAGPRVVKQFRGNGGNGVFKVKRSTDEPGKLSVVHAKRGSSEQVISVDQFFEDFRGYFDGVGPLLNQEWNKNLTNGMVRCYVTRKQVVGFGYQEVNALFPEEGPVTPGKRFYFTEKCALFADLKERMETYWIDQLIAEVEIAQEHLPMIWDADFFINSMVPNTSGRYTLCEINVSSVSPFPASAIPFIVKAVNETVAGRAT